LAGACSASPSNSSPSRRDSRPKVTHWFALDESRPLFAFAGIWRLWSGERRGEMGEHSLFAFLTTQSNDIVRPIPPRPCRCCLRPNKNLTLGLMARSMTQSRRNGHCRMSCCGSWRRVKRAIDRRAQIGQLSGLCLMRLDRFYNSSQWLCSKARRIAFNKAGFKCQRSGATILRKFVVAAQTNFFLGLAPDMKPALRGGFCVFWAW
jgi:hypothetical protein